jgi:hypothetical protein
MLSANQPEHSTVEHQQTPFHPFVRFKIPEPPEFEPGYQISTMSRHDQALTG